MLNYRSTSLMSVATKTYNKILVNRLRKTIDSILRKNQAGSRKSMIRRIDKKYTIQRILQGALDKQLLIYITFIDFRKAFYSVDKKTVFDIPSHHGIPMKMIKEIQTIYNNSRNAFLMDGQLTEEFNVATGILQYDKLAPFLFIIVIDYIMNNA